DDTPPLTLGEPQTGTLIEGQRDIYTFTLGETHQVMFDAISGSPFLTWTLTGPRGQVMAPRQFNSSDGFQYGSLSPALDLVAGTYTLTIDGPVNVGGAYSFKLLNFAQAP